MRKYQKELVFQLMALVQSGCKSNDGGNSTAPNIQSTNSKSTPSDRSILSQCGPVSVTK